MSVTILSLVKHTDQSISVFVGCVCWRNF